jgi:hypothetical protein
MSREKFEETNFREATMDIINQANSIIGEYTKAGYDLTLRQLYYQFVARAVIPNTQREYQKLSVVISNARLAGLLDWDTIVDRTRHVRKNSHWDSPDDIIDTCAKQFRIDTRENQDTYIEVWIEKDALIGILKICDELDVSYLSCRGYVSQSALYLAAKRFKYQERCGKETVLLHLGDHDPSGIDMSRDIQDRLKMFGSTCTVKRIALTSAQVQAHNPPPNPAKLTDSRVGNYLANYGDKSWELDALDPKMISQLIETEITQLTDGLRWTAQLKKQAQHRKDLQKMSDNYASIVTYLKTL